MRGEELQEIITEAKGERAAQVYLEKYPEVLGGLLFSTRPHVVSQFRLGDEYVTDFVVARGFSGGWEIKMVELESPSVPMFNKDGSHAKSYNKAHSQVTEWKRYVETNREYFLKRLSETIKEKDLNPTDLSKGKEPTDSVGWLMTHPQSMAVVTYVIIISNRGLMEDEHYWRRSDSKESSITTMTYDRVLEQARHCDSQDHIYR
jgi:hypothetical protein